MWFTETGGVVCARTRPSGPLPVSSGHAAEGDALGLPAGRALAAREAHLLLQLVPAHVTGRDLGLRRSRTAAAARAPSYAVIRSWLRHAAR